MVRFSTKTIAMTVTGIAVAGAGLSTALAYPFTDHKPATLSGRSAPSAAPTHAKGDALELMPKKPDRKSALPTGVSTATSFWDPGTASGKPMSYHTIASPYWPLGTKVKIIYGNKSAMGVVEDFGPAEWAVAQHSPPAIVDLSEEMMQTFTGARSNSVRVKFQVVQFGHGPSYRKSGTGYDMATGIADK